MPRIKLYTVDEAERTLPLVKKIIRDIQTNFEAHGRCFLERRKLPLSPNPSSAAEERAFQLENEMEQFESEVFRFQRELEAMGVEVKDYARGLLDFYSRYEGRIVYLCWKSDEDTLGFWHDLQSGFVGRQPLTPANRMRFKGMAPGENFIDVDLQ